MKYLFILIATLLISTKVSSQNAENVEKWLYSVEKEFPEIDRASSTSTLRSGMPKYNRIRFNLLSDRYFVPVFGKPFDKLGALKKNLIARKFTKLKRQKKFGVNEIKHPWAKRLDWYMSGVFIQPTAYNTAIKEVISLRKIRQQYNTTIQNIQKDKIDFDYLSSEKTMITSNYTKLLPSEIDLLKKLIDEKEGNVANKALVENANKLKILDNSFTSLAKLKSFLKDNLMIHRSANQETRDRVFNQNETKTNQILDYLVKIEIENLSSLSISELNNFHKAFYAKFSDFNTFAYKQVKGVENQIKTAKTKKVIAQIKDIESKIELTENGNDLFKLEQLYLSFIHQSNEPKIVNLNKTVANRKITIINEKKRIWQEEEEKHLLSNEIRTDGLYYAEFYDYIYRGHFENLKITPEDPEFVMIFTAYLNAYGTQCDQYLPADKVEIQELSCKKERITEDQYGFETSRVCVEYVWVGSNIFARRDLYEAKITVSNKHKKSAAQTIVSMVTNANTIGNYTNLAHKNAGLKSDMKKIFKLNKGDSDAIKKFEDNLIRFTLKKPSVRLDKESKYINMKKMGGPTAPQNHYKLLNDLVLDQSKTWSFNRYKNGSISNIVPRISKEGKIYQYYANYIFKFYTTEKTGSVIVKFENGLPECIYFSDYPENCKTPNQSVITSFAKGDYTVK